MDNIREQIKNATKLADENDFIRIKKSLDEIINKLASIEDKRSIAFGCFYMNNSNFDLFQNPYKGIMKLYSIYDYSNFKYHGFGIKINNELKDDEITFN